MDYLQYDELATIPEFTDRFKPYYKWITFNIFINSCFNNSKLSFKPYYKWITFNMKYTTII